jgi:hypothetical protein
MGLLPLVAIKAALNLRAAANLLSSALSGAHGCLPFTKNVDIVIQLIPESLERTFSGFASLGHRPIGRRTVDYSSICPRD